jgi:uncharacterized protein YbaA (DUF1428 family)
MGYVDGFVVPVPIAKLAAYEALEQQTGALWRAHGALAYQVTVADDVKPGQWTSFPQSVDLQEGETVVFAWVTYRSRAHRDQVVAAVMADPRMAELMKQDVPFDGKRMFWGGFAPLLSL